MTEGVCVWATSDTASPDDIYIRYQSFRDAEDMKAAMVKRQPHKIDIGAVFTVPPKDHNTVAPNAFRTVEVASNTHNMACITWSFHPLRSLRCVGHTVVAA